MNLTLLADFNELSMMHETCRRLIDPHVYRVSLCDGLNALKSRPIQDSLDRGAQR